jgi:hypothetical protein
MGYTNSDMEPKFLEIIIKAEIINEVIREEKPENDIYIYVGAAVLLISIALFSASYIFKRNETDELISDGPVLIPLESFTEEGFNEKVNQTLDVEDDKAPFSVISGSEFSRQVSFICETGCSKEFKGKGDDEEIMCPYCGTIGESPL